MRLFFLIFVIIPFIGYSQIIAEDYYQFPINLSDQHYLSGTFGEIRNSHFHMGIDIKTEGKIGVPVCAVADGYIFRIKISAYGYGKVLYMKHPNGTFSVYAHLNDFNPSISDWTTREQYGKKSFEIDVFPESDQFVFEKGEIIAYTGNTGSSMGPHLHFEIRDTVNQAVDVLKLGFKEIKDTLPPMVKKIAFITLEEEARINGFFGRYEFDLIKTSNQYQMKEPISLKGRIGVELYCYDQMDGVSNKNGVVKTIFKIDGDTVFVECKEVLSFKKQRNALVHYNYSAYKKGSKKFNKLYLSDGNEHTIYDMVNRGLHFDNQSELLIETGDAYQNFSITRIGLSGEAVKVVPRLIVPEIIGNYIHFKSDQRSSVMMNEWHEMEPYAIDGKWQYYVLDLRKALPNSLFINGDIFDAHLVSQLPSDEDISYLQEEFRLDLKKKSLFDTLYLAFKKEYDTSKKLELFHFKNATEPIRLPVNITLNPVQCYDKEKAAVYSVVGNRYNYVGGKWEGDKIKFSSRNIVSYTILEDSIPPSISTKVMNTSFMKFRIGDNLSGIKSFEARINGEFVLMSYEPKQKIIWSQKLNKNISFKGEFILTVIDHSNNKTIYTRIL